MLWCARFLEHFVSSRINVQVQVDGPLVEGALDTNARTQRCKKRGTLCQDVTCEQWRSLADEGCRQ